MIDISYIYLWYVMTKLDTIAFYSCVKCVYTKLEEELFRTIEGHDTKAMTVR